MSLRRTIPYCFNCLRLEGTGHAKNTRHHFDAYKYLFDENFQLLQFAAQHVAREQMKYAKAGAIAEEALTNIKIVSAYSGQPTEVKRYVDQKDLIIVKL